MSTISQRRDAFFALVAERCAIMGILNVTPDSFSDGGRFDERDAALAQARRMAAEGADIIDIGAESTRPGHQPVPAEEEWRRLEAILPALVEAVDVPVSIDTQKAEIARRALEAGAAIVNDVWGFQRDPAMAHVVAEAGAGAILMHNRASVDPAIDIADDMHRFFERSLNIAAGAGMDQAHIALDPGIGFGKTKAQNLRALAATADLGRHGRPVLIGVSRKSLFGALLSKPPEERLVGTLAANLAAAMRGARIFRVHDVAEHRMALSVLEAIEHAG